MTPKRVERLGVDQFWGAERLVHVAGQLRHDRLYGHTAAEEKIDYGRRVDNDQRASWSWRTMVSGLWRRIGFA